MHAYADQATGATGGGAGPPRLPASPSLGQYVRIPRRRRNTSMTPALSPARPRSRRARAALLGGVVLLAACGSAGQAADDDTSGTVGGVGKLPAQTVEPESTVLPPETSTTAGASSTPVTTAAAPAVVDTTATPPGPIGSQVSGNKLLMVGDSIFAGTASRYGNEACDTLVPLGWQVDVEAESGRAIDFGERVVRKLMPQGWDVVVFFLGTNYGGNEVGYAEYLNKALDTIGPDIPVVLLTTTEYAPKQLEVNTEVANQAATRPNVVLLDWGAISTEQGLLSGDGYHPSEAGRQRLIDSIAYVVGPAPVQPGKCLKASNTSDKPNVPGAPTTAPKGSSGGSGTTTTKAPSATTTAAPVPTVPGTSGGTTTTTTTTTAAPPLTSQGTTTTTTEAPPPTQGTTTTTTQAPDPPTTLVGP